VLESILGFGEMEKIVGKKLKELEKKANLCCDMFRPPSGPQ
jgi:hypothetical protein